MTLTEKSETFARWVREEYPPTANGPFVGKQCSISTCTELGRYAITPVGADPQKATLTCGRHLGSVMLDVMDASGHAVVVQEVPRTIRYRDARRAR